MLDHCQVAAVISHEAEKETPSRRTAISSEVSEPSATILREAIANPCEHPDKQSAIAVLERRHNRLYRLLIQ